MDGAAKRVLSTHLLGEKYDSRHGLRLVSIGSSWKRVSFRLVIGLVFEKNVEKALGFSNL